jgi:pimeloyl-ACP methyl ester carboxylesterase
MSQREVQDKVNQLNSLLAVQYRPTASQNQRRAAEALRKLHLIDAIESEDGPVLQRYAEGDKEGAVHSFVRWAIGPDYRTWLDRMMPGAYDRMVADADSFFGVELPSLQEWYLTREDARRITQPVLGVFGSESASIWSGWSEVQQRLREWVRQTELFVLAGANHALAEKDPRGVAEAMVPFLARHPMPAPV